MIRKDGNALMTSSIRVAPLKTYMMPNASDEYRAARENLIDAELALREHVQRVAELRRTLPAGPTIPDYEFVEGDKRVRLSELFSDGKPYLLMYHVMYWQDDQEFCPMCSMWVDGLDGVAHHISQRANIVAATFAPADKARAWAKHRGWQRIRFLADADPSSSAIAARRFKKIILSQQSWFSKRPPTAFDTFTPRMRSSLMD
jgi:predicted dithiol-disulfide oxidoreductase (DUF899 family)